MTGRDPLVEFEAVLGHRFERRELLIEALTHASVADPVGRPSFERLEFLGDRVLGLIIAKLLFDRFPGEDQGDLSRRHARLVNHETLAALARDIGVAEVLAIQPGTVGSDGALPPSILEDALEAVIGAVYLDQGLAAATTLIEAHWGAMLTGSPPSESKTELQEWAQARGLPLPVYETVASDGPAHAPIFTVEVTVEGHPSMRAEGGSKRVAERAAATALLAHMKMTDG